MCVIDVCPQTSVTVHVCACWCKDTPSPILPSSKPTLSPPLAHTHSLPRLGKDAISLLAAVASDITGSVWLCPSEVIKQARITYVHLYVYMYDSHKIPPPHTQKQN